MRVQQGTVPPTSSVPPGAGAPSVGQPGAGFGMVSDVPKTCSWRSWHLYKCSNEQLLLQEIQERKRQLKSSTLGLNQPSQEVGKQLRCVYIYCHQITAHCCIIGGMILTTYFSSVIKKQPFLYGGFSVCTLSSAHFRAILRKEVSFCLLKNHSNRRWIHSPWLEWGCHMASQAYTHSSGAFSPSDSLDTQSPRSHNKSQFLPAWFSQKLSKACQRWCACLVMHSRLPDLLWLFFPLQPPAGTGMTMMPQQPVMFAQPMMRPPFGAAAVPGTQVSFLKFTAPCIYS